MNGFDVEMAGMTDRGLVRSSNEDSFLVLQGPALASHHLAVLATSKSGTLLLRRDQGEMAVL